ncbi:MAG: conjugal transfer protein TraF, partial [Candidatus Nitrotoga sp.]
MFLRPLKLVLFSALLASSSATIALPFNSFDPRSMAMGGAGVAVGDAAMAPFFNPALLGVTKDEDDFSVVLPILGVRVYDPEDFSTSVDNFQQGNFVNRLQASINAFNLTPSTLGATAIATDTTALNIQLATLDGKPIQAEFGAATVIGIPGKKYGGAFFASGSGALGGVINYRDSQTLTALAEVVPQAAACPNAACLQALANTNPGIINANGTVAFTPANLQSKTNIRGVVKAETGISLARELTIREQSLAIGLSPKIVKVLMFDVVTNVNTDPTLTGDDYRAEYTNFNFDLGMAKNHKNGWRSGLVVKNIIPYSYDFKRAPTAGATPVPTGAKMELRPQARVGVSHSNSWSTVALDVDLTRNDPAGLEDKSQYIALGGELDAFGWAQIRAGYRADLVNNARNVASLGLGLALFKVVHVDI